MIRTSDRTPSRPLRTVAAACLTGLLLAGSLAAGSLSARLNGQVFTFKLGGKPGPSSLSKHLAIAMRQVSEAFAARRAALVPAPGRNGLPAYPEQAVRAVVDDTERDLDQALERAQKSELEPMTAWVTAAFLRLREGLPAPSGDRTSALLPGFPGGRTGAVFARLDPWRLPGVARAKTTEPTIGAAQANPILDQVGKVIGRILFLAEGDNLQVKLWVGTTPQQQVRFRFWPAGSAKGPKDSASICTNGSLSVLRGLYSFSAKQDDGPVAKLLTSDTSAAGAGPGSENDKLDLVNGSGFFCCRFEESYCHHVNNEKECQPERR